MLSNGGRKRKREEALCSSEGELASDAEDTALSFRPRPIAENAAVQCTDSQFIDKKDVDVSHELTTERKTLQDVPREILDLILIKTIFKVVMSKTKNLLKLANNGKILEEVMELRNVWSEWNYRLTTNWFKIMFKRRLKTLGWMKFLKTPFEVGLLNSMWFKRRIIAMTILDDKLYVIGDPYCTVVQEFTLNDLDFKEYWMRDCFEMKHGEGGQYTMPCGSKTPVDLVSCKKKQHLYVSLRIDRPNADGAIAHYYEVAPLRVKGAGKEIDIWPEMELSADSGILSVTGEANVLTVDRWNGKLMEFTSEGMLIRAIDLSRVSIRPSHAVKTADGNYVTIDCSAVDESQHRVCKVDVRGNMLRSFGGAGEPTEGRVNFPTYMAINEDGFVLVAERDRNRVLVLDTDLRFNREIDVGDLRSVDRIALDEKRGRILVTDNRQADGDGDFDDDSDGGDWDSYIAVVQMVDDEFIEGSVKDEMKKALAAKRQRTRELNRLRGVVDVNDKSDSDETSTEDERSDYDYDGGALWCWW